MDWYERNKKINSLLNEEFEGELESLKDTCKKIKNKYKTFTAKRILGVDEFPNILTQCENKKEEQCNTLAEKCICRAHKIEELLRSYENDFSRKELIEDLKMFWNIISYDLLPLEILWGMEYEKEDDRFFSESENEVYDFLKNWANYYLKTTKKYYLLLSLEYLKDEKLSNFQKALKQLNAPYKKTEAYEIFGNRKGKKSVSTFWDTEVGHIEKYKNVNMNRKYTKFEEENYMLMDGFDFSDIVNSSNKDKVNNFRRFQEERRLKIVENFIENELYEKVDDLKEISKNIEKEYKDRITEVKLNVPKLNAIKNPYEKCNTLTEKFINRMIVISELKKIYVNRALFRDELENYSTLTILFKSQLLPLEVLYYLEELNEKNILKPYSEPSDTLDYLSSLVNFYLRATDKYEDIYKKLIEDKKDNGSIIFEDSELKELQKNQIVYEPLPLEKQQELFDEIVLGKNKEDVKSLRLINKEENK